MAKTHACPVHRAVDILGAKWALLVLHNLGSGPRGFNELLHAIEGVNPRALSLRLKELVEHGLVTKQVRATTPVRVEYALAPEGKKLAKIIAQLGSWAEGAEKQRRR